MTFRELVYLISTDLFRYAGKSCVTAFMKHAAINPGFKYTFCMRLCRYLRSKPYPMLCLFPAARFLLRHYSFKFGISIPYPTEIGKGFYIGHFGGIIVHPYARIGSNCNISQQVTIGQANRGKNKGYPTIGDNVYIGPGARIIGNVKLGNRVAVGANCVVTFDVPDDAVVAGVPGKIISHAGSEGYVNLTGYPEAHFQK